MQLFGPPNVSKLETKQDIKGLVNALKDKRVQQDAVHALIRVGAPAIDPLLTCIKSDLRNPGMRCTAIEILANLGAPGLIVPLRSCLQEHDPEITLCAAKAFVEIGDTTAIQSLLVELKSSSLAAESQNNEDPIVTVLKQSRWEDVSRFNKVLWRKLGDAGAVELLIDTLTDKDLDYYSKTKIVEIGRSAVPVMINALKNRKIKTCRQVVNLLAEMGDPSAIGPLGDLLIDKKTDAWMRRTIIDALIRFNDPSTIDPLGYALNKQDCDATTSCDIINALSQFKDPRVVSPIVYALMYVQSRLKNADAYHSHAFFTENESIQMAASSALNSFGAWAAWPLADILVEEENGFDRWDIRSTIIRELIQLGQPAVDPLIKALENPNAEVRMLAASALGDIGDERAIVPLIAALGDRNNDQRRAEAFSKNDDAASMMRMTAALRGASLCASVALGQFGSCAREQLAAALQNPDPQIRQLAAELLAELGDSRGFS